MSASQALGFLQCYVRADVLCTWGWYRGLEARGPEYDSGRREGNLAEAGPFRRLLHRLLRAQVPGQLWERETHVLYMKAGMKGHGEWDFLRRLVRFGAFCFACFGRGRRIAPALGLGSRESSVVVCLLAASLL